MVRAWTSNGNDRPTDGLSSSDGLRAVVGRFGGLGQGLGLTPVHRLMPWVLAALVGVASAMCAPAASAAADPPVAYVANYESNSVTPIDTATDIAGTPIPVGAAPLGVAITPDGKTAYVTDSQSDAVTPIDTATKTAGTPIPVGALPFGVAITPDGKTAYVADSQSAAVTPIDLATDAAGTQIPVGTLPARVAITPDGRTAYVTDEGSESVTPIDTATNIAGVPIPMGEDPVGVAITPDGRTAYVTDRGSGSNSVTPIDTATDTPGTPFAVGAAPYAIAITPDQGPAATFSATPAPAGEVTSFDASGSLDGATYRWNFGDGATATTDVPTAAHLYPTPGAYTVTLTVTDEAGCSTAPVFTGQTMSCNGGVRARTTRDLTITPPPPSPPSSRPAAPVLRGLKISPARFSSVGRRVGGRCVKVTGHDARRPECTRTAKLTIRYTLSAAATITFAITGRLPGRKVGGRCVARRPGDRHRKKCTRPVAIGAQIARHGQAGADHLLLSRRLVPGTYRLTATPAGGARQQVTFKILG